MTTNSSSTALVIRPSLVTGLFTRTKIDGASNTATAVAGVQVRVLIGGKVVAPGTPAGSVAGAGDGWVFYDKRYQYLASNLFGQIETCALNPTLCYIELVLSTLGAHSLDFVVGDVGGATHDVKVEWRLTPTTANANEAACVGPGVLTVQQVKTFSQSGGIVITLDN